MKNITLKRSLIFCLSAILVLVGIFLAHSNPMEGVSLATGALWLPLRSDERKRQIINNINMRWNQSESNLNVTCQESYLRFDQKLANNSTNYKFDFRQSANTNTQVPTTPENMLIAMGDAFIATAMQIQLGIVDTSDPAYEVLYNGWETFNNRAIFSVANLPGTTLGDIETLYNTGFITYHMGNTDFIDRGIPVQKFKVVPNIQGNGTTSQSDNDHQVNGWADFNSLPVISGKQENWFLLNTINKAGIAWQATSGTQFLFVSMQLTGVLVKGFSEDARYPDLMKVAMGVE